MISKHLQQSLKSQQWWAIKSNLQTVTTSRPVRLIVNSLLLRHRRPTLTRLSPSLVNAAFIQYVFNCQQAEQSFHCGNLLTLKMIKLEPAVFCAAHFGAGVTGKRTEGGKKKKTVENIQSTFWITTTCGKSLVLKLWGEDYRRDVSLVQSAFQLSCVDISLFYFIWLGMGYTIHCQIRVITILNSLRSFLSKIYFFFFLLSPVLAEHFSKSWFDTIWWKRKKNAYNILNLMTSTVLKWPVKCYCIFFSYCWQF